jgi:hypothetical protein
MNNVIGLLPKLLDASRQNREVAESAAKIAWIRAAGDGLRLNAVPVQLYQNALVVAVADGIWQKQLRAMSRELLPRVNRILGRDLIKLIEFRIDPSTLQIARQQSEHTSRTESAERALSAVPDEVAAAAGAIQDETLRRRFLVAAGTAVMRRRSREIRRSQV